MKKWIIFLTEMGGFPWFSCLLKIWQRYIYEAGYLRRVVKGGVRRFFLCRFVRNAPICLKPHFWAFWDITTHARNLFGRKIPSELGDTGGGSWKTFHLPWFSPIPYVIYIGNMPWKSTKIIENGRFFNFHHLYLRAQMEFFVQINF